MITAWPSFSRKPQDGPSGVGPEMPGRPRASGARRGKRKSTLRQAQGRPFHYSQGRPLDRLSSSLSLRVKESRVVNHPKPVNMSKPPNRQNFSRRNPKPGKGYGEAGLHRITFHTILSCVRRMFRIECVSCQLSVVSCQLSVVNCQLSVVSCQLSVVSCQIGGAMKNVMGGLPPAPAWQMPVVLTDGPKRRKRWGVGTK